jgi:alkanesulfonate monooxygenase SsuD/methylene tetrahydromethanopterin reductase-like flavin-dependent oxidoreductase (luciferase family)
MSYRHPAVLAKIAATVDMVSEGRLEFGVGAGWKDVEYQAYGIPFPSPGQRVDRFLEGMRIIKGLWTQDRTTVDGQYYSVHDAVAAPKPLQSPHPPILIGGSRPRMLRAMARFADAVNMGGAPDTATYKTTLAKLRRYCEAEGTDFDSIRKTHFMTFLVGRDDDDAECVLKRVAREDGMTPGEYRQKRTRAYIGTADGAVDLIRQYADLGVTQIMTAFPYKDEMRSMDLFAESVIPRLK